LSKMFFLEWKNKIFSEKSEFIRFLRLYSINSGRKASLILKNFQKPLF
jgi:hypothetical protein